jgi:hypothetical protein
MSKSRQSRYLRILQPEEFIHPGEWPKEVGLAILVENDCISQIHPFLTSEPPMDMLVRIAPKVDKKYTRTPVIPKINGIRTQSVPFSKSLEILKQLEKRIAANSDLLTEAENFEINFRYAMEAGMNYEDLLAGSAGKPEEADAGPDDIEEDSLSIDALAGVEDLRLPHSKFADAKIYFDNDGCATHVVSGDGRILHVDPNIFFISENHLDLEKFRKFDVEEETRLPESKDRIGPTKYTRLTAWAWIGLQVVLCVLFYNFMKEHAAPPQDPVSTLRQEIFQN